MNVAEARKLFLAKEPCPRCEDGSVYPVRDPARNNVLLVHRQYMIPINSPYLYEATTDGANYLVGSKFCQSCGFSFDVNLTLLQFEKLGIEGASPLPRDWKVFVSTGKSTGKSTTATTVATVTPAAPWARLWSWAVTTPMRLLSKALRRN